MVLGVAAANLDTYSVLDSILDVDDAGKEYREKHVRVIRYGIAVMLSDVTDWLDEHVPHWLNPKWLEGTGDTSTVIGPIGKQRRHAADQNSASPKSGTD
jgi:hypothetical protein